MIKAKTANHLRPGYKREDLGIGVRSKYREACNVEMPSSAESRRCDVSAMEDTHSCSQGPLMGEPISFIAYRLLTLQIH